MHKRDSVIYCLFLQSAIAKAVILKEKHDFDRSLEEADLFASPKVDEMICCEGKIVVERVEQDVHGCDEQHEVPDIVADIEVS